MALKQADENITNMAAKDDFQSVLRTLQSCLRFLFNLVPRAHVPFGQGADQKARGLWERD